MQQRRQATKGFTIAEDKIDLFESFELTDEMLEGANGGFELPNYHKGVIRGFTRIAKEEEHWDLERFIQHLRTESPFSADPNYLEAAITYAREVW